MAEEKKTIGTIVDAAIKTVKGTTTTLLPKQQWENYTVLERITYIVDIQINILKEIKQNGVTIVIPTIEFDDGRCKKGNIVTFEGNEGDEFLKHGFATGNALYQWGKGNVGDSVKWVKLLQKKIHKDVTLNGDKLYTFGCIINKDNVEGLLKGDNINKFLFVWGANVDNYQIDSKSSGGGQAKPVIEAFKKANINGKDISKNLFGLITTPYGGDLLNVKQIYGIQFVEGDDVDGKGVGDYITTCLKQSGTPYRYGITNNGYAGFNKCYMISSLIALFTCGEFINAFITLFNKFMRLGEVNLFEEDNIDDHKEFLFAMVQMGIYIENGAFGPVQGSFIMNRLRQSKLLGPLWRTDSQHDAGEFIDNILNVLNDIDVIIAIKLLFSGKNEFIIYDRKMKEQGLEYFKRKGVEGGLESIKDHMVTNQYYSEFSGFCLVPGDGIGFITSPDQTETINNLMYKPIFLIVKLGEIGGLGESNSLQIPGYQVSSQILYSGDGNSGHYMCYGENNESGGKILYNDSTVTVDAKPPEDFNNYISIYQKNERGDTPPRMSKFVQDLSINIKLNIFLKQADTESESKSESETKTKTKLLIDIKDKNELEYIIISLQKELKSYEEIKQMKTQEESEEENPEVKGELLINLKRVESLIKQTKTAIKLYKEQLSKITNTPTGTDKGRVDERRKNKKVSTVGQWRKTKLSKNDIIDELVKKTDKEKVKNTFNVDEAIQMLAEKTP